MTDLREPSVFSLITPQPTKVLERRVEAAAINDRFRHSVLDEHPLGLIVFPSVGDLSEESAIALLARLSVRQLPSEIDWKFTASDHSSGTFSHENHVVNWSILLLFEPPAGENPSVPQETKRVIVISIDDELT